MTTKVLIFFNFSVLMAAGILSCGEDVSEDESEISQDETAPENTVQIKATPKAQLPTVKDTVLADTALVNDKLAVVTVGDSIEVDSLEIDSLNLDFDEPEIRVAKDELIQSYRLKAKVEKSKKDIADTLAQHLDIDEGFSEYYQLELWQSPLGYEGYRCSGNRILIYGMDSVERFSIKILDEQLLLLADKRTFVIDRNADFSPLKPYTK